MTETDFSPAPSPYNEDGSLRQAPARANGATQPAPQTPKPAVSQRDYLQMVNAAIDIASTKILGLIATLSACGIWAWAVFDPVPTRTYAAATFSVSVLIPIILLYWKRGE